MAAFGLDGHAAEGEAGDGSLLRVARGRRPEAHLKLAGATSRAPHALGDADIDHPLHEPRLQQVHRDFSGIHVCEPALLETLGDDTAPSIIMHYMKLSRDGARIARHDALTSHWIDIGTHEKLDVARRLYTEGTGLRRA